MSKSNCIFFVQGEGNGHLTEAIALYEILVKNNYLVNAFIIGERNGILSNSFQNKIQCPVFQLKSPGKVTDRKKKFVVPIKTLFFSLTNVFKYWRSLRKMHSIIKLYQPSIIFNFYEPLVGLYTILFGKKIKFISIAHQYLYLHPNFKFPKSNILDQFLIKTYTKVTAYNSDRIWALSSCNLPRGGDSTYSILPPILRKEIFKIKPSIQNYLLVYLAYPGYLEDILIWHSNNPNEIIHCFVDVMQLRSVPKTKNLFFHALNDIQFLEKMSTCKGIICTAGFETMCESVYLKKPIMVVPIKKHFGQFCNSRVSFPTENIFYDDTFNLDKFLSNIPSFEMKSMKFNDWVDSGEEIILQQLSLLDN